MLKNRWIGPAVSCNENILELEKRIGLHPLVCQILSNRGFENGDEVDKFLNPSLADLHDPFIMKDMEKAVDRLVQALHKREKIVIYGDYDVDGITSISLLVIS